MTFKFYLENLTFLKSDNTVQNYVYIANNPESYTNTPALKTVKRHLKCFEALQEHIETVKSEAYELGRAEAQSNDPSKQTLEELKQVSNSNLPLNLKHILILQIIKNL